MPVKKRYPVPGDIDIAQEAKPLPISEVAAKAGLLEGEYEASGRYKARIGYKNVLDRLKERPDARFVTVTAITPTPLGEGKTVTASEAWAKGGEGALELADAVLEALKTPSAMKYTFPDDIPIEEKIMAVATKVHLADALEISATARKKIELYEELGFGWMSVNMAKTHLSLSHDPDWLGVPRNFKMPIRDIRASVGAGFFYPVCGTMMTMPGLPSRPAFVDVDIDLETGKIKGLF